MESQAVGEKEATLKSAIDNLVTLSWQLNGLIFGERPEKKPEVRIATNSLLELRDTVLGVNERIKEGIEALRQLK